MVYFSPTLLNLELQTKHKLWHFAISSSGISGADTSPWTWHASTAACDDENVIMAFELISGSNTAAVRSLTSYFALPD